MTPGTSPHSMSRLFRIAREGVYDDRQSALRQIEERVEAMQDECREWRAIANRDERETSVMFSDLKEQFEAAMERVRALERELQNEQVNATRAQAAENALAKIARWGELDLYAVREIASDTLAASNPAKYPEARRGLEPGSPDGGAVATVPSPSNPAISPERCPVCEGVDQPGLLHNERAEYCSERSPATAYSNSGRESSLIDQADERGSQRRANEPGGPFAARPDTSSPAKGNMGGVLHQERADHLRRAAESSPATSSAPSSLSASSSAGAGEGNEPGGQGAETSSPASRLGPFLGPDGEPAWADAPDPASRAEA